ncbi:MAG: hypothetical protein CW341_00530 [Bacteroidetes bacterium]|nr:hypothetical protein [Bacteroidota bacterium]
MKSFLELIKRLLLYAVLWLGPVVLAAIIMVASGLYDKDSFWDSGIVPWMLLLGNTLVVIIFLAKGFVARDLGRIERQDILPMIGMALLIFLGWVFPETFLQNLINVPMELTDKEFDQLAGGIAGILDTAFITPIAEEIIFRGLILGMLFKLIHRPWIAILISALVFGAIHMTTSQFIFGGLYGLLLGWLFWRTGSIWPGVIIHVANNASAMLLPDAWWDAIDNLALSWQVPVTIVCLGLLFIGLRWYHIKYPTITKEKTNDCFSTKSVDNNTF